MDIDGRQRMIDAHGARTRLRSHVAAFAFFVAFYLVYFSPVLVSGRLLAPGDGAVSYLPAVARGWSLWIDELFAGYPAFADTQHFLWYPLRLFGSHYNALVVSAYVIAAFCTYGFARLLSGSMLAGVVAGLIYSGGGFMTAHLGHLSIIHSAAWIPFTLWGIEGLARNRRWPQVATVACGVALSFLGGHPQVWVYGLLLAGAFASWRSITLGERVGLPDPHYLLRCGLGVATGIAIAAVQLLPFAEFTGLAARGEWTYADYTSFSLPPLQLLTGVFPNLFGNVLGGYSAGFGALSLTELSFYAGASSLVLAALAPWSATRRRHAWFWFAVALLAAMYMTADATLLGRLGFHVPVLRSFRALGRVGVVYILAVAVLAACAIAALQRREIVGRRLRWALLTAAAAFVVVLGILYGTYDSIFALAASKHVAIPAMSHNKAVWVPLVLVGAGLMLVSCATRWPRFAFASLIALVAVDLASFGWFYEWRIRTVAVLPPLTPPWQKLVADAQRDGARVLPVQRAGPAVPNVNLLYGLPSASGYVSLMPKRFGELTGTGVTGVYPDYAANDEFWNLLGIRWMLRIKPASDFTRDGGWRPLAVPLPEYPGALERVDFAGRAWLVGGVVEVDDAQALETIRSGVTPFRSAFDARAVALVGPRAASNLPLQQPWGKAGTVQPQRLSPGHWRFVARAERPAVLVVSQMDYPGWQASIEGVGVPLLRVDYALQGVVVPAGESVVELTFRPHSLYIGGALSALGLLVIAICIASPRFPRRRTARSPATGLPVLNAAGR